MGRGPTVTVCGTVPQWQFLMCVCMCVCVRVQVRSLFGTGSEKPQWGDRVCVCLMQNTDNQPTWWAGPKLMVRGERARTQWGQHSDSDDVCGVWLQFGQQDPGF